MDFLFGDYFSEETQTKEYNANNEEQEIVSYEDSTTQDILSRLSLEGKEKEIEIWGYGENKKGQLAVPGMSNRNQPSYSTKLTNIVRQEGVISIDAGANHCALVTGSGKLYTWGNGQKGQLGHSTPSLHSGPSIVDFYPPKFKKKNPKKKETRNTEPGNAKGEEKEKENIKRETKEPIIKKVGCGNGFTVCVDQNNDVWSWGNPNCIGRELRVGKSGDNHKIPAIVTMPENIKITEISCGSYHTIIKTEEGRMFGWGANDMGQLGFPNNKLSVLLLPLLLPGLGEAKPVSVKCGKDFTLVLGDDNNIYSFGNNISGQLGRPSKDIYDCAVKPIPHFTKNKIMMISCGEAHSACLVDKGVVYIWGCCSDGRMGYEATQFDVAAPVQFQIAKSRKHFRNLFVHVACGAACTYVITTDGNVFGVGTSSTSLDDNIQILDSLHLSSENEELLENRFLLYDVSSIVCGKGNFSLFCVSSISKFNLKQHVIYGNASAIQYSIEKNGTDSWYHSWTNILNNKTSTSLITATLLDRPDVVEELLKHGERVERSSDDHVSAVHVAVNLSSTECLKLLVEWCLSNSFSFSSPLSSPLNFLSPLGSPLHIASRNFNIAAVHLLLKSHVDRDLPDSEGCTALHLALEEAPECEEYVTIFGERRDLRIVKLLIQSGASVDVMDNRGNVPFTWAKHDLPIVTEWASAVDVLIIADELTDQLGQLTAFLKIHSLICKVIDTREKDIEKEDIIKSKIIILYSSVSSVSSVSSLSQNNSSWENALDIIGDYQKFLVTIGPDESAAHLTSISLPIVSDIQHFQKLYEAIAPKIAKIARQQRVRDLEERLNMMVKISLEEIERSRLEYMSYRTTNTKKKDEKDKTNDTTIINLEENNVNKEEQREIRLFLSSTFRDMFYEREQLVKNAFPELSLYCHQNGLFFTEVDLRWGITEAQAQQGEVLNICLGEVDKCRPFFCCILGERYGWYSNPNKPDPLLDLTFQKAEINYPWISKYKDRSVTELEILHGVLNDQSNSIHYFYFKDPTTFAKQEAPKIEEKKPEIVVVEEKPLFEYAYTFDDFKIENHLSSEQSTSESVGSNTDSKASEEGAATLETTENTADDELAAQKLSELKQSILDAGCNVQFYKSPEELANMIVHQFKTAISSAYPPKNTSNTESGSMDSENELHKLYSSNKARFFAGREKYLIALEDYVNKTEPLPMMVVNEVGGAGQSSLLAKFAQVYSFDHPSDVVIEHYISASSNSSEITNIQLRLIHEIKRRLDIKHESQETESSKLLEELEILLGLVANKIGGKKRKDRKVVLIIDALHVVDRNTNSSLLSSLPISFPPSVRVIFSTQAGTRSHNISEKRKYPSFVLAPLKAPTEVTKMVESFLGHYCKTLSPNQVNIINQKSYCCSPLYLRTILEELRVFGVFEELTNHINFLLSATSIDKLYNIILDRLEKDLGPVKDLFVSVLTALWAARDGLSEHEIKTLFSTQDYEEQQWNRVFKSIQRFIVNMNGLESLGNDHIRKAIEVKYVNDKVSMDIHSKLATYFASQSMSIRKATQLPYHYLQSNNMKMLKSTISNFDIFIMLYSSDILKPKLLSWWRAVPGGVTSAYEAYEDSLSHYFAQLPSQDDKYRILYLLAHFCNDIHDYKRAEAYMKRVINIADVEYAGKAVVSDALMDLVSIMSLRYTFALGEEENLLKKALTIRKAVLGELSEPVADVLEMLAKFYRGRRDYYSAGLFFEQAIKIREKMRGNDHPSLANAITGMAWIYQRQYKFKLAIELGAKLIELLETAYGSSHPEVAVAYTNYGLLLNSQDQMTKATVFLKAALSISEQLYGKESKNAHQIRVYLLKVYSKMKKTEEIKIITPLIEQFEEDSDPTATFAVAPTEDESKAKVIKVTLGNDMSLLDTEESSGKTAGEVQKNRNQWTVFVRSPDPDINKFISSVEFRFHPDWTTRGAHKGRLDSNIVKLESGPFTFSGIGWPPIHGLPKDHREDIFKMMISITFNDKLKCEPVQIPYELVLPVKTEMATTETTGNGREIEYEFIQENGRAYFVQFLGKSAVDPGGWIDRL